MLVGLSILVITHESGHYLAARAVGMKVLRYSIGFGPTLFKHKPKGSDTTFQVAAIPFLAYVQIAGMNPQEDVDEDDPEIFPNKSLFARAMTIAAGPAANYLAAVVIAFFIGLVGWPSWVETILAEPVVAHEVQEDGAAYAGGLRASELADLLTTGIHYDLGVVRVMGKGSKERVVPIGVPAFKALQRYTDELRQDLLNSSWVDSEKLTVPSIIWPLTNTKILVMEWLDGQPLIRAPLPQNPTVRTSTFPTDPTENSAKGPGSWLPKLPIPDSARTTDSKSERSEITTLLFRAFLSQYFVTGFFHADPHPGNLFYLGEGRVAILDCGMMGRLDPQTRATLTELVLAIVSSDAQRCAQLTLNLTEPLKPVDLVRLESDYSRLLGRYYGLDLSRFNTAEAFGAVIETGIRNNLRWPANIGLFTKSLANLEGAARQFDPSINLMSEIKPLMVDLFQQQLIGTDPMQLFLRTGLEFRNLSLSAPRQLGFLLDRLSDETLQWNVQIQGMSSLQRSLERAANRRAFSTVVAALIIGAAIISTSQQTAQLQWLSTLLFAAASFLGLWLIGSILRSGRWQ